MAKGKPGEQPAENPKGKGKLNNDQPADEKRPRLFDNWTGKTPKSGWHRPDYNIQGRDTFRCTVRLSKHDIKTGTQTLHFTPTATTSTPETHTSAAIARHFAATYTLHRLLSTQKQMHLMLPPAHRTYWKELPHTNNTGDPVQRQRAIEEGREEDLLRPHERRRWEAMAEVTMAEEVVRTYAECNKELVQMGFNGAHGQALDWLLVHVPEGDLPSRLARQNVPAFQAVRRLAQMGFPTGLCAQMLEEATKQREEDSAEPLAAYLLWARLCGHPQTVGEEVTRKVTHAGSRVVFWFPAGLRYPEDRPAVTLNIAKMLYQTVQPTGFPIIFDTVSVACEMVPTWTAHPPRLAELMVSLIPKADKVPIDIMKRTAPKKRSKHRQETDIGELCEQFARLQANLRYQEMQRQRAQLPIWKHAQEIVGLVETAPVVVIAGATGCGKTTQVPQFLLDHSLKEGRDVRIVCTQPRRVSAISVARRVALEHSSTMVGYAVRGESQQTSDTRLLFCTTGVLLQMLADLDATHVVLDEVHERSVDSDLLLALLKPRIKSGLKVVLMSATMSDKFARYFGGAPIVKVPGRTFPVAEVFVEDFVRTVGADSVFGAGAANRALARLNSNEEWAGRTKRLIEVGLGERDAASVVQWEDQFAQPSNAYSIDYPMVKAIVEHIDQTAPKSESILIFMPGMAEILETTQILGVTGVSVLPLHSMLSPQDQQLVFQPTKNSNRRKVIVATNIAETSITINDIGFVVDTGRVREIEHTNGVAQMVTRWCSRAAIVQRRGRAGRTKPGTCYHVYPKRLFAKAREFAVPEIQQTPLEQVCLRVRWLNSTQVLQTMLDPPPTEHVKRAEQLLVDIGACEKEELTAMGRLMAQIPADLRLAKMLILGALFGALEPTLKLVALMSLDRPLSPQSTGKDADALSDWLADLHLFNEYLGGNRGNGVSPHLRTSVERIGLGESQPRDVNELVLRALVFAGLSLNVARVTMPRHKYQAISGTVEVENEVPVFHTAGNNRVFIHPRSALFKVTKYPVPFVTFLAQHRGHNSDKVFLRDATVPGLLAVLMFGPPLSVDHKNKTVAAGKVAAVRAWPRVAVLVNQLRRLLDELLRRKLDDPANISIDGHPIVNAVLQLIQTDGR
ncbi:P-loop containing nucleoside triphosphate hydrolase protein [Coemansia spiralis]|nr:P-loop containing nucleoside triphosphate hydrolase protein [Coemansia spiralis]